MSQEYRFIHESGIGFALLFHSTGRQQSHVRKEWDWGFQNSGLFIWKEKKRGRKKIQKKNKNKKKLPNR